MPEEPNDKVCTDPKRWEVIPDADSSNDEILARLKHIEACPFHAKRIRIADGYWDSCIKRALE